MGMYKYLTKMWRKPTKETKELRRTRLIEFRKQPSIVRVDKPTRIDKARRLGYKAKQGFVVVRAKIRKGGRHKIRPKKGRRPKRMGRARYYPKLSLQSIAEQRVARKYKNLEVLNSYYVGDDSVSEWYEVILVDPTHTSIYKDKDVRWIVAKQHTKRVYRGKTSASQKSRGLKK